MEDSQVKSFFENQTVFLTGGSGFLGKVLIEKLLRDCDGVKKIYVLVRPKKGKTPNERFTDLFNYPCFEVLKSKNPKSLEKVSLIIGDCQKPRLGINDQDVNVLVEETTCVIHAAANVKFDQTLKEATYNVRATRDLLELAKLMTKLQVFVFVSTAYSNCIYSHIEEKFYEPPMKADQLFSVVDAVKDDTLQAITPNLLGVWPNAYIYTKSISEDLIKSASDHFPTTIVRPAIVMSSVSEPVPGWIDNFYGVVGIVVGAALGVLRSLHAKKNAKAALVPVDYVCNCILAAASRCTTGTTKIYNFAGDRDTQQTWAEFMETTERQLWKQATVKVLWYYTFKLRENKIWHNIVVFFQHTVQAYVVDFVLFCLRKPTLAVRNYQRLNKMTELISYFSTRSWDFDYDNVTQLWNEMNEKDKKLFFFNMKKMDWDDYLYRIGVGGRIYLLKDPIETIPKARKKIMMLFIAHYTIVALFYYLLYKLLMLGLGQFLHF